MKPVKLTVTDATGAKFTEITIKPEQWKQLSELAESERWSVNDVFQQCVHEMLDELPGAYVGPKFIGL
jgi:hypothetical protein